MSVKQNGYEIYQSTVPPGPFTIDDLYAAGNGGDLQVTIKEADGTPGLQRATVNGAGAAARRPYPLRPLRRGVPQRQQPAGNARFFQSTAMHGLPAGWTLYGGAQLADRYRAFNLGVGKNMGYFGALSLDITSQRHPA